MAGPILEFAISQHAAEEMKRRGLDEATIRGVLAAPDQRTAVRPGRDVLQSRFESGGRRYLVRVFVDVDRTPAQVVTAYRTSNITKYWRPDA
ncbi:MAG: DUF4258 domain-containing protein [Gemmatimonadaceae bacterium]